MQAPILSVGFLPGADTTMRLLIQRDDSDLLNTCDWTLPELAARGYDGACLVLGNLMLRMLQRAHPEVFTAHPGIAPPPPVVTNTEALVMELIVRSDKYCTRRYVATIDDLVARLADEPGRSSLIVQWPEWRRTVLEYPD